VARRPEAQRWIRKLFVAVLLGFLGIGLYAMHFTGLQGVSVAVVGLAIAGASGVLGVVIGFLFGLPRTGAPEKGSEEGKAPYRANTNLKQISDWLTMILVGVGLVQLGTLRGSLGRLARSLEPGLGDVASSAAIGLAILGYACRVHECGAQRVDLDYCSKGFAFSGRAFFECILMAPCLLNRDRFLQFQYLRFRLPLKRDENAFGPWRTSCNPCLP